MPPRKQAKAGPRKPPLTPEERAKKQAQKEQEQVARLIARERALIEQVIVMDRRDSAISHQIAKTRGPKAIRDLGERQGRLRERRRVKLREISDLQTKVRISPMRPRTIVESPRQYEERVERYEKELAAQARLAAKAKKDDKAKQRLAAAQEREYQKRVAHASKVAASNREVLAKALKGPDPPYVKRMMEKHKDLDPGGKAAMRKHFMSQHLVNSGQLNQF